MKKINIILIVFLSAFAIFSAVVNIFISNSAALDSIAASKLERDINNLSEENIDLRNRMLALSSYNTIASRAGELGYKASTEIVSVYDPVKVAALR